MSKSDVWKEKYSKIVNERDTILQAVLNDLMYNQPVKYSLRTKLIKHCNERGIEIPVQIQ
jgi:hypothetical protein